MTVNGGNPGDTSHVRELWELDANDKPIRLIATGVSAPLGVVYVFRDGTTAVVPHGSPETRILPPGSPGTHRTQVFYVGNPYSRGSVEYNLDQNEGYDRKREGFKIPGYIHPREQRAWVMGWLMTEAGDRPRSITGDLRRVLSDIEPGLWALCAAGHVLQAVELAKAQGSDDLRQAAVYWVGHFYNRRIDLAHREMYAAHSATWQRYFSLSSPSVEQRWLIIERLTGKT